MEPRDRAEETLTEGPLTTATTRVRLLAGSVVLVALAFIQQPGLLTADTKFDLVLDPGRFLARAASLWDGESALGQLQNQAYGYLWPMGPFFWGGDALGIPGWAVQRGWLALVLVVAFLGAALCARALGVRSDLAILLAGAAYALSPRMLTTLGPISIEAWPSALAPWVLLPLLTGATRGSPRLAAARSALAVAMVGGVNAAATFAVLPLGAWWLLTRSRGPRRRALMTWWPVFTVVATLWWLLPLFLLGSYSPPFLDYIESAANTTFPTTLFDSLRGTSNWVPYVDAGSQAGNDLIRQQALIIDGGALLAFGLAGLVVRPTRHRLFLGGGVVLGLLLVTAGHLGAVQGWAAPDLQRLLDASLAPLRNVHKFDPVVRLPMVLGLALLVDALRAGRTAEDPQERPAGSRLNSRLLVGTAVLAVIGSASPALAGRIPPAGASVEVPDYWYAAARYLQEEDATGTALLLPGSPFGEYLWGRPHDEPFQSLARTPWAVRNAVPLTPAGSIRMLDAVERRLAQGEGSAGLAAYLRRAGVTHLLVRNDLERGSDVPEPVLVHQALEDSPGLRRVATFGPQVGGEAHILDDDDQRVLVNGGWQDRYRALELYAVDGGPASTAVTADDVPVVVGGPEDLLDLADLGVLADQPTELGMDADPDAAATGPVVLTDGLREIERNFGRVHDGDSQTLSADDPQRLPKPTRDYLPDDAAGWQTTAGYDGGVPTASSSMADADALGTIEPGLMPYAAVDGDPATAWSSNNQSRTAPWWQLGVAEPRAVDGVAVTAGPEAETVVVRTANAVSEPVSIPAGGTETVDISDDDTAYVRVEDASGRLDRSMALSEVDWSGVEVRRRLRLPAVPEAWGAPDAVVLRAVGDDRTGCVRVEESVRCVPRRTVAAEEPDGFARSVTVPAGASYDARLRVRGIPGDALLGELLRDQPLGISASTTGNPDPRGSALAAIDGDTGTAWTADLADLRPELRLNWLGQRNLRGLRMIVDPDTSARVPRTLTLTWPGGSTEVTLGQRGRATFPPIRTDTLRISIGEAEPVTSLDFASRAQPVPVGVSVLKLRGVPYDPVSLSPLEVDRPCGSGPDVMVDGSVVQTTVTASPAELYAGEAVDAELCGLGAESLDLTAGANDVEVRGSDLFAPVSLTLTAGTATAGLPAPEPAPTTSAGGDRATYDPGGAGLLAVAANTNPGWSAEQDGQRLDPVVVDGWRLGWRLDGSAPVETRFAPQGAYRAGLVAGGVLLALFVLGVAVATLRQRRREPGAEQAPLVAWTPPPWLVAGAAVVASGLLAGWPGALVGVLAVAVAAAVPARAVAVLVGLVLVPAVLVYALRPWGDSAGWAGSLTWPHYLVVGACVLAWCWSEPAAGSLQRVFSRIAGSSTKR